MFCTNCGKEFSDGSNFCPHCGTPAVKDESDTVPSVSGTVVPEETAVSGKQPSAADAAKAPDTEERAQGTWKASYQKNKMIGVVTYRRIHTDVSLSPSDIFVSRRAGIRAPVEKQAPLSAIQGLRVKTTFDFWDTLLFFAFLAIAALCVFGGNPGEGAVSALLAAVCFFTGFGKEILVQFRDGTSAVISTGSRKAAAELIAQLSRYAGRPIPADISKRASVIVGGIAVLLVVLGAAAGLWVSAGDQPTEAALDGEYAVFLDSGLENEYLYLHFNCNGPGTVMLYTSDAPEDILELRYAVTPAETADGYSLTLYSDAQPEGAELLRFAPLDADTYTVVLSGAFTDGTGMTGTMVPFTQGDGIASGPVPEDTAQQPDPVGLPAWCSGSYYGQDLYSTITFPGENGAFDIFIYRLVAIDNCTVTAQEEYQIAFTGEFDIDVGSVSGTLGSYDDGVTLTLTITDSDWDLLPAGTTMEFYCDYRDPNYVSTSDGYGLCGIYALPETPASRVFVWQDTEGTYFMTLANHGETVTALTLASWELENINDTVYFSTYTMQEEGVSGAYDTLTGTLTLTPDSADSLLCAYGFDGIFFKQSA